MTSRAPLSRHLCGLAALTMVAACGATDAEPPRGPAPELHGRGAHASSPAGRVYYETEGSGPPVVLVPGGPGNSHAQYHGWFSRLAGRRTVVYMDQIGCGRSGPRAGAHTVEAYAQDIEAVRIALGSDRLDLIGLSFGGFPAIEYALTYPQRVRRLVLVNGHASAESWQATNIDGVNLEVRTQFPEVWAQIESLRSRGVKSSAPEYQRLYEPVLADLFWAERWRHPRLHRGDDPRDQLRGDVYLAFVGDDPEWTVAGTLAGYDARPRLSALRAPVLIVAGRWDRVTPPSVAFDLRRRIPRSRIEVFERSGHRPWCEEPEAFFRRVEAFLSDDLI